MKKKIVTFGDSFIFGSELADNHNGRKAWPGLIANELGLEYETRAVPGCGNENIARQVLEYFSNNNKHDVLAVINWTWAIRYDFYLMPSELWITLGPTCVPRKLDSFVPVSEAERIIGFYQDYLGKSTTWDRYRSLMPMYATQQYLSTNNITNIQNYMDYSMFDTEFHAPDYIQELQNLTKIQMTDWDGMNFLDWCKSKNFDITTIGWHPLEQAHAAAAEFWKERYKHA
jgi:hypothetical protein